MEDLEQEAAELIGEGEVILIGDFNAITASSQTDISPLDITWEEEGSTGTDWTRTSQDTRDLIDGHGEALLRMCNNT